MRRFSEYFCRKMFNFIDFVCFFSNSLKAQTKLEKKEGEDNSQIQNLQIQLNQLQSDKADLVQHKEKTSQQVQKHRLFFL